MADTAFELLSDTLYEDDFYAWLEQQARLLKQGRFAEADVANIIEEIEALGRKEVAELRSRYTVLLLHLLKEIYQPSRSSRSWKATILDQRIEIARHMRDNPSLKSRADDLFVESYSDARKLAASETGLSIKLFPAALPFTRDQALDESWHPTPAASPTFK